MLEFRSGDKSFSQDISEPGSQTLGLPRVLVFLGCSSALGKQQLLYSPRFSKIMLGGFFLRKAFLWQMGSETSQCAAHRLANLNISLFLDTGLTCPQWIFLHGTFFSSWGIGNLTHPRVTLEEQMFSVFWGVKAVLRSRLVKRSLGVYLNLCCFAWLGVSCPCKPRHGGLGSTVGLKSAKSMGFGWCS